MSASHTRVVSIVLIPQHLDHQPHTRLCHNNKILNSNLVGVAFFRYQQVSSNLPARHIYSLTWFRLDGLAVGAWLAMIARNPKSWSILRRKEPLILCLSILGLYFLGWEKRGLDWVRWDALGQVASYLFISLISMVLISMAVVQNNTDSALNRLLSNPILTKIGAYSYGMYLFHLPIECIARWLRIHPSIQEPIWGSAVPYTLTYILVNTIASYLCAYASWHLFEKHCLKLKKFFQYKQQSGT